MYKVHEHRRLPGSRGAFCPGILIMPRAARAALNVFDGIPPAESELPSQTPFPAQHIKCHRPLQGGVALADPS